MSIAEPNSYGSLTLCFGSFAMLKLSFAASVNFSTKWQFDLKIVYLRQRHDLSLLEILANQKHLTRKKDNLNFQAPVDLPPAKEQWEKLIKERPNLENTDENQDLDNILYYVTEVELDDIVFNSDITDEEILKVFYSIKRRKRMN